MTIFPEPLVLVPGVVSDARVFAPQIEAFSAVRPVCVAHVAGADDVGGMAEAVLAGAPPRFSIAGHGLGGSVAFEVWKRAPERVARLAAIAADCLPDTPSVSAAREALIVAARAGRLREAVRQARPTEALAPGATRTALAHMSEDMGVAFGADAFVRQLRALQRRPDHQRTLRAMRCPVLILGGRHDTLNPPRRQDFMATLCHGAQYAILEEAGHLPMLEDPEGTIAAMTAWLDAGAPLILRHALA